MLGRPAIILNPIAAPAFNEQPLIELCLSLLDEHDPTNVGRLRNLSKRERELLDGNLSGLTAVTMNNRQKQIRRLTDVGADTAQVVVQGDRLSLVVCVCISASG